MMLYHWVPLDLCGSIIYPLSQLKDIYPERYKDHVRKYEGRERTMQQIVPFFDCLWNDVVFLDPVPVEDVNRKRAEYSLSPIEGQFFKIDSGNLDQKKLLVYMHRPDWLIKKESEKPECLPFLNLTEEEKVNLAAFPSAAEWGLKRFGEKALLFGFIPHVLYLGSIETEGIPVIDV